MDAAALGLLLIDKAHLPCPSVTHIYRFGSCYEIVDILKQWQLAANLIRSAIGTLVECCTMLVCSLCLAQRLLTATLNVQEIHFLQNCGLAHLTDSLGIWLL